MKVPRLAVQHFSKTLTWKQTKPRLKDGNYDKGWKNQGIVVDIQQETKVGVLRQRPTRL
jgi:hypothetical protein